MREYNEYLAISCVVRRSCLHKTNLIVTCVIVDEPPVAEDIAAHLKAAAIRAYCPT
jgi:hypothetical protein